MNTLSAHFETQFSRFVQPISQQPETLAQILKSVLHTILALKLDSVAGFVVAARYVIQVCTYLTIL